MALVNPNNHDADATTSVENMMQRHVRSPSQSSSVSSEELLIWSREGNDLDSDLFSVSPPYDEELPHVTSSHYENGSVTHINGNLDCDNDAGISTDMSNVNTTTTTPTIYSSNNNSNHSHDDFIDLDIKATTTTTANTTTASGTSIPVTYSTLPEVCSTIDPQDSPVPFLSCYVNGHVNPSVNNSFIAYSVTGQTRDSQSTETEMCNHDPVALQS
ncbi:unnamed protein product [Trichobilharzia regenti]|nr:unnamed protein product [Trichobilharzia regenti]